MEKDNLKYMYENWDKLNINSKVYYFHCDYSISKKIPNEKAPGVVVQLRIYNATDKVFLSHEDFKSYIGNKICEYIKNTLNGQRTLFWDNKAERSFK